ncbi:MAG: GTP-binding protein [Verrucomicrobiota bacterium]
MSQAPLVYILYGIPNSGRREVLFDLIDGGVPVTKQVLYFRPSNEDVCPYDEQLEALENVAIIDWELKDGKVTHGSISAAPEHIFFLAPGTSDPSDIAEAVKSWTDHNQCEIGRIVTVVHCNFLQAQPQAKLWFDACIHFSDIVLLNRREDINNKWVKEFEEGYRKQCIPSRFLLVKKGRVANPPEVLDPEARRTSLYFDELIPIEEDEFEDDLPEDQKPDAYIERLESGQRARPVPDIRKFF